MTRQETLEQARWDYPVGTKFIPAHLDTEEVHVIEEGDILEYEDSDSVAIVVYTYFNGYKDNAVKRVGKTWSPSVWFRDNWAKIVYKPNSELTFNFEN